MAQDCPVCGEPALVRRLASFLEGQVMREGGFVLQGRNGHIRVRNGWHRVLRSRGSEQWQAGCEQQQV
jgi:hypothetical protein